MDCEMALNSTPIESNSSHLGENSFPSAEEQIPKVERRHTFQSNPTLTSKNFWHKRNSSRSDKIYTDNPMKSSSKGTSSSIMITPPRFVRHESTLNPWFFNDPELTPEYATYKKQYFNILTQFPNLVVLFTMIATHSNFDLLGTDSHAYYLYTASFVLASIGVNLLFVFTWAQIVLAQNWYNDENDANGNIRKICRYIMHKWMWGRIEDIVLITAVSCAVLLLIGRVFAGQCPPDDLVHAIWSVQACNPFAVTGGIPFDAVLINYALPLGAQTFFTGVTAGGLVVGWIIVMSGVIFSVAYVQSPMLLYVILLAVFFITMSYEFERRMRISFLQARLLNETTMREFDYKVTSMKKDHELEILGLSKENEKKLMEAETLQLRGLMGNVAHDLKTPLHSITAELEIMKSDIKSFVGEIGDNISKELAVKFEKTMSSIFDSLEGTCHFMTMAINRSQDFMKASSNIALVPQNETFDLAKTISAAVGYITSVQSGRILVVDPLPPGICTHIISDKQWLCENLMCFISNAVKYSDRGAQVNISATLGISDTPESGVNYQPMLHFMVEDTGVGIAKDVRCHLFQPFKQAQRMAGGTGLGLYSLAKRVEALGGSCGVDGRRDGSQGSMFWFKIPYRPDETMSAESLVSDIVYTDSFNHTSSKELSTTTMLNCLVVDDTLSILKMLERVLKQNGHHVTKAENGLQSLELLKKSYETGSYFDVVLTDLQMPVLDGFESMRRFREFETNYLSADGIPKRHQLVIGMSANSDTQSRQDALDVGMDDFVTKPFKYDDLKTILPKHLRLWVTEH